MNTFIYLEKLNRRYLFLMKIWENFL